MKTKILSAVLTGILAVGAVSQGLRTNALCVDGKCEFNKHFELSCDMNYAEAIKHFCLDAKDLDACRELWKGLEEEMVDIMGKHSDIDNSLGFKLYEEWREDTIKDYVNDPDLGMGFCDIFNCNDRSYEEIANYSYDRIFEIFKWFSSCPQKANIRG